MAFDVDRQLSGINCQIWKAGPAVEDGDDGRSAEALLHFFESRGPVALAHPEGRVVDTLRALDDGVFDVCPIDVRPASPHRSRGAAKTVLGGLSAALPRHPRPVCLSLGSQAYR